MTNDDSPLPPAAGRWSLGLTLAAGALATVLRVVPHPPNLTGMGAVGLFGGGRLRSGLAVTLPLGIMAISDLALWAVTGFDPKYSLLHVSRAYVYAGLIGYVLIGRTLLRGPGSFPRAAGASLLGSLQFFLLTNFFEWLLQPLHYADIPAAFHYTRDLNGLLACYAAALPFFQGEAPLALHSLEVLGDFRLGIIWLAVGDLFFTTALYGASAWLAGPAVVTSVARTAAPVDA